MKKIIIIGGGPAGMMAAIRAAEYGASVRLLEKNDSLGKKLLLTGKGRCNVTNAGNLDDFLKRYFHGSDFLRDAFKVFFNDDMMKFFKDHGVPLKVERQQRVFPESDRASSILKALEAAMRKVGVEVRLKSKVKGLRIKDQRIIGIEFDRAEMLDADSVIVATGGLSYPATGSTGDGIIFAERSGHRIIPLKPALVGVNTAEHLGEKLQGLTLKNITLSFLAGRKRIKTDIGELLFTGTGISGPLIISYSGEIGRWLDGGKRVYVDLDLKPALSEQDLTRRLEREFKKAPKMAIKNLLKSLLPQRLIEVFLNKGKIDPDKPSNQLSFKEIQRLIVLLKNFRLTIEGVGSFDKAMVTQGGISLKDVDPRTMVSRRIKNLFFAGEVLNVDGDTGGFNLQAAFSTGYLAGQSSANMSRVDDSLSLMEKSMP